MTNPLATIWYKLFKKGATWKDLGEIADGYTENAVRKACQRLPEYKRDHGMIESADLFSVPIPEVIELEGDAVIVHDVHTPAINMEMTLRVLPVAEKMGVKRVIFAGDFVNMDYISKYADLIGGIGLKQEMDSARVLLDHFGQWFDEMYWIRGNHEDRWLHHNRGQSSMEDLRKMVGGVSDVVVSNRDILKINTNSGLWIVPHGGNYGINQLTVGNDYAQKYQANVIMGHQHHLAKGWDRFGRYVIIDNGGLFDKEKLGYVQMKTSKSNVMKNGFTVLKDGYARLFGEEPFTNWEEVLK